jgi:hypothetical protein
MRVGSPWWCPECLVLWAAAAACLGRALVVAFG